MDSNPILQTISNWFKRNFADPEAVSLFFVIVISLILIEMFGRFLAPIIVAVVVAFLLNSIVRWLERLKIPHMIATLFVFIVFLGLFIVLLFWILPLMWRELGALINETPKLINKAQSMLTVLAHKYPNELTPSKLNQVMAILREQSMKVGQVILSFSLSSIGSLLSVLLYVVLVPLMV